MYSCVIVVENLPVPLDRRVWQEALHLKRTGWDVSVICPQTERHPEKQLRLEGIDIYRHPMPAEGDGFLSYLREYGVALLHESRLLAKIYREKRFDVIQLCNPPDILFLGALPYKLLGVRVIFDHHDICPELYFSKYGKRGPLHALLGLFERLTFKFADAIISANHTFRHLAISRGGKDPDDVFTVYSVPDVARFRAIDRQDRGAGRVVIGYIGVMGKQDGVDNLVHAVIELTKRKLEAGFVCRIVGDGRELDELKRIVEENQAEEWFDFTGFVTGDELLRQLGSFDIGVIPDPPDEYNDKISMNKVFEYSAIGIPIVAFRLSETMRLLGIAGNYAAEASPAAMADALQELVESAELRAARGEETARRFANNFDWRREALSLTAAYRRAVGSKVRQQDEELVG